MSPQEIHHPDNGPRFDSQRVVVTGSSSDPAPLTNDSVTKIRNAAKLLESKRPPDTKPARSEKQSS